MVLSRQVYISDGTTKQYPIAFADGYLSRDEVNVYEEYDEGTPDKDIPFTFINDNLIQLTTVPKSGTRIVIERDVEATARKVVFIPQYIKSSDLNTMYQHLLYLIQALMDGRLESTIKSDLDMGYNKIINLGAPTNDNDAVRLVDIKTYTDLAKSLNQQNAAYAAAAKVSETNAKASENAAKASQTAAAASAKSASDTANGFDAHAADKQQDFDDNAESKTNTYNSNASTLLQQYTDNAAQKLSAYNSNDATKKQAFNDNYTSKLNSFNSNASEKQAQVDASAETARKWAIGTISEQPQGSAKYWAEQAKTATAGTLNESILTNCLTEIPQDIKLELSNGTLTLKAGSKVYVPNGVGKFDVVTIQKDVGGKRTSTGQEFLLSDKNGGIAFWGKVYSGDSKPVDSGSYVWYDTANNVIKATTDGGASWLPEKFSLPLGIYTANGTGVTSIDQVFNGFGYIGNNTFILPGVKCKRTNGFNTDGSLNSIDTTFTRVTIPRFDTEVNRPLYFINGDTSAISNFVSGNIYVYDKSINNFITRNTKEVRNLCFAYSVTKDSTGRITSLTPNTAFHATDYNEFAREVGRSAKVDEDNTFTGVNKFNKAIIASGVAYTNSNYVNGFSDILLTYDGNKNWWAQLRARNTSKAFGFMGIYVNDDTGEVKTHAPSPHISDNSTQIATTAWVNNKFQKVSTLPAQPDPNVTYLIPEE